MSKENKINLASSKILNEIGILREPLIKNPDFVLLRDSKIHNFLKNNADRHSVALEFPNKGKKNHRKEALNNLIIAKGYLYLNFDGELSEEQIKNAAALINGYDEQIPYRTASARTFDKNGYFIYPENVADEMYKFIFSNKSLKDPIEKAVHSHFNIARIHPFEDGNGRLARLVQNTFLDYSKYPPIIIPSSEREDYLDLLSEASREYREKGCLKSKQVEFYNYLFSKLKNSLKEVKKQIKSKNKI